MAGRRGGAVGRALGRLRALARRLGWGVSDQAMSSATNFAIGLVVARELGPAQFGAFSLAFATYLLAMNASRGLATDPLVVRYSGDTRRGVWAQAAARATGTALVLGLVVGAGCLVAALVLPGSLGRAFLALAVTMPGLLLQDSWRFAFFAHGRGGHAFLNDLVWVVALAAALTAVMATGRSTVFWLMLAWGASAAVAAVSGAVQARVVPRPTKAVAWAREHRDLAARYAAENLSLSAGTQLRFYGLAAIAGLAAVGTLRAAELLLGPMSVIIGGIGMMAVPEAVRVLQGSLRRLRPFCVLLAAVGSGGAVLWGAALLLLVPDSLGVRLLGASWAPAAGLLVPTTIAVAAFGVSVGAWAGLRALGVAKRSLRAQLVASALALSGALAGAAASGATGAAWGTALGTSLGAANWWWQLQRVLRPEVAQNVPAQRSGGYTRSSQISRQ